MSIVSSAVPDPQKLGLFIVAALVLLVTPGPAVFYIVARSIGDGLRTGILSAIGMTLGGLVHVGILVAGFAAFVANNPDVRGIAQVAGSFFLVYLGLRRLQKADTRFQAAAPASDHSAVIDAALVNLLNPKAIIFLLAFLPQFTSAADAPGLQLQIAFLGAVFLSLGIVTDVVYAVAASKIRTVLITEPNRLRVMQRVSGAMIILLGVIGIMDYSTLT